MPFFENRRLCRAIGPAHLGFPSWAAVFWCSDFRALAYLGGRPILAEGLYLAIARLASVFLLLLFITTESRWTVARGCRLRTHAVRLAPSGFDHLYCITGAALVAGTLLALRSSRNSTNGARPFAHYMSTEIAARCWCRRLRGSSCRPFSRRPSMHVAGSIHR